MDLGKQFFIGNNSIYVWFIVISFSINVGTK